MASNPTFTYLSKINEKVVHKKTCIRLLEQLKIGND